MEKKPRKKYKPTGKPVGSPSKYKPEYNGQVHKLCLLGATDKEIANFFEVAESTVHKWKLEFPKFSESIREGKILADMEVTNSLYSSTKDRVVIEQQAIKTRNVSWKDGKKVENEQVELVDVERVIPMDFRSQQFWLKNRQPDKWRDKQEISHSIETETFEIGGQKISF